MILYKKQYKLSMLFASVLDAAKLSLLDDNYQGQTLCLSGQMPLQKVFLQRPEVGRQRPKIRNIK